MRTIAVLPAFSKLVEISILQKLEPIVYNDPRIIDYAQTGFRPGCGTEVHLVRVLNAIETVTNSLNDKENQNEERLDQYHLVFLDLRKAYDNVDRDILLARMLGQAISP